MGKLIVTKKTGGLGRRTPSEDNVSGIMTTGIAVVGGLQLDTNYVLLSIDDAIALGIDADYDDTNSVLLYYHISEFFRMNPDGELHLRVAAQTQSLTDMANKANAHAKALLSATGGKIKQLAIIRNPLTSYVPVLTGGLDGDVLTAIPLAQALYVEENVSFKRPCQMIIEGRSFNGTVAAATDLRSLSAENVSVTIGADPIISAAKTIERIIKLIKRSLLFPPYSFCNCK